MTATRPSNLDLEVALTINGQDVATSESFDVINPATASVFAAAPCATAGHIEAAMAAAEMALNDWRRDESERRAALLRVAQVLLNNVDDLAHILTAEMGRPLAGSRGELEMSAAWARYYAELDTTPQVIQDDDQGRATVYHRPLGVVVAITPWNFPISLMMWKLAPALLAGNTIVVKPSPYTPLTTLRLGQLLQSVLPPGVVNVLSGPDPLGAQLTSHRVPSKIAFTGSVATGLKVAASAAIDLKRVTLELGGNDAAIILDDIDVEKLTPKLFWDSFYNSGQICCAVKRVYAPRSRYNEVVDSLVDYTRSIVVGDGMNAGVGLGPLNNAPQLAKVAGMVDDALLRGARAVAGGQPLDRPGYFYEPTILADADHGMDIVAEEQFGPVLPIVAYTDEADAVRAANDSRLGLNGSVWTSDEARGANIAAQLHVGTALVNAGSSPVPHLPFGGIGLSGIGRENGRWGYDAFTEVQTVYINYNTDPF